MKKVYTALVLRVNTTSPMVWSHEARTSPLQRRRFHQPTITPRSTRGRAANHDHTSYLGGGDVRRWIIYTYMYIYYRALQCIYNGYDFQCVFNTIILYNIYCITYMISARWSTNLSCRNSSVGLALGTAMIPWGIVGDV